MPNSNQVGFVYLSYYPNQYSYLTPVDASAINRQETLNYLEIEKRRALHDEDLRYEQEKKRLNQHTNSTETPKHINGSTRISMNETPTSIDWKKLVDEFIKNHEIYLKIHISKLEKSSLRRLEPHQVMFMNGFLDVREFKFYSILESKRN